MPNPYRVHQQVIDADVSVLGGVSMKAVTPEIILVLTDFLQRNGHRLPIPLTTVYRVNVRGTVYYCKQYKRVKKRNSYTVAYLDSYGTSNYGLVECFVVVDNEVIAIFHPLSPLCTTVQHFDCTNNAVLDFMIPVTTESCVKCCFVKDIICKCIFIDFSNEQYVVKFPSSIMFD